MYFRLNLPGHIEENDESKGTYESDSGKFIFNVDKLNQGEHFKNLEFSTTLLNLKDKKLKLNSKIVELGKNTLKVLYMFINLLSERTAQVRALAWTYTLFVIYTNHFEPISTSLQLRTHLRFRAEIIDMYLCNLS